MFEAVIAGASVVGGVCAKQMAAEGIKTAITTDKIGKEGKCTCIVSKTGLDRTGIAYREAALHKIHGANIWSGGSVMTVRTPQVQALVLDRFKLDNLCVSQAEDAGAELYNSNAFQNFDGKTVQAKKSLQTKILVGADGVGSTVARTQSFSPLENIVVAWEGEFDKARLGDPSTVDVFLDFPGLFGWIVPCGEERARVGVAVKNNLQHYKKALLQMPLVKKTLRSSTKKREFCHAIPLKYRKQTQKQNVLLVGDAAGQVKATTGGGIVFGALCAKEAAEQTKLFLEGNSLGYEKAWRSKYAKTLDKHIILRKLLDISPKPFVSFGLSALNLVDFNRFLESHGDMDFVLRP